MPRDTATARHIHLVCQAPRLASELSERLLTAGYLVSASETEGEARARLRHQPADALVVHLRGSGASCLRLIEDVATRQPRAFVLLVGPERARDRLAHQLPRGGLAILPLPLRTTRLIERLEQGLREPARSRQTERRTHEAAGARARAEQDFTDMRRWHDRLVAVNRISQALSASLNADEIISTAFTRLSDLIDLELLGMSWTSAGSVWVRASDVIPPERVDEVRTALSLHRRALPRATDRSCKRARHAALFPGRHHRAEACATVPLMVGDRPSGVLHVERAAGRPFTAEDAGLLESIAEWLALALRNAEAHRRITNLALTDSLTGLLNRRAFDDHLTRMLRTSERYGSPACLIMADLDHFKNVNDALGHPKGDEILRVVATLIGNSVRAVDVVARYGGEEFAILLPHTSLQSAKVLGERLRASVARHIRIPRHGDVHVTISLGIAEIPRPGITSAQDLIAAADQALYRSKTGGRNRVETTESIGKKASEPVYAAVPLR